MVWCGVRISHCTVPCSTVNEVPSRKERKQPMYMPYRVIPCHFYTVNEVTSQKSIKKERKKEKKQKITEERRGEVSTIQLPSFPLTQTRDVQTSSCSSERKVTRDVRVCVVKTQGMNVMDGVLCAGTGTPCML